jgi:hypothetical protein
MNEVNERDGLVGGDERAGQKKSEGKRNRDGETAINGGRERASERDSERHRESERAIDRDGRKLEKLWVWRCLFSQAF